MEAKNTVRVGMGTLSGTNTNTVTITAIIITPILQYNILHIISYDMKERNPNTTLNYSQ